MAEAMAVDRGGRLQGVNLPAASPFVNPDSAYHWLRREALDAGDVPLPSTCPAAAPGPIPVAQSVATRRAGMARWPAAPGPARNPGGRSSASGHPES
jgi:hypothetical protein